MVKYVTQLACNSLIEFVLQTFKQFLKTTLADSLLNTILSIFNEQLTTTVLENYMQDNQWRELCELYLNIKMHQPVYNSLHT